MVAFSFASGYRTAYSGAFGDIGGRGHNWSATTTDNNGCYLYYLSTNVSPINSYGHALGLSIRCVQHLFNFLSSHFEKDDFIFIEWLLIWLRWFTVSASGYRERISGVFTSIGSGGYAWSSAITNTSGYYLTLTNELMYPTASNSRGYGLSVRCVQNLLLLG